MLPENQLDRRLYGVDIPLDLFRILYIIGTSGSGKTLTGSALRDLWPDLFDEGPVIKLRTDGEKRSLDGDNVTGDRTQFEKMMASTPGGLYIPIPKDSILTGKGTEYYYPPIDPEDVSKLLTQESYTHGKWLEMVNFFSQIPSITSFLYTGREDLMTRLQVRGWSEEQLVERLSGLDQLLLGFEGHCNEYDFSLCTFPNLSQQITSFQTPEGFRKSIREKTILDAKKLAFQIAAFFKYNGPQIGSKSVHMAYINDVAETLTGHNLAKIKDRLNYTKPRRNPIEVDLKDEFLDFYKAGGGTYDGRQIPGEISAATNYQIKIIGYIEVNNRHTLLIEGKYFDKKESSKMWEAITRELIEKKIKAIPSKRFSLEHDYQSGLSHFGHFYIDPELPMSTSGLWGRLRSSNGGVRPWVQDFMEYGVSDGLIGDFKHSLELCAVYGINGHGLGLKPCDNKTLLEFGIGGPINLRGERSHQRDLIQLVRSSEYHFPAGK